MPKKKTKTKPKVTPFDPSKLSDQDIATVFKDERLWKHPRFKELNDKAKKADDYIKKQEEAAEEKLLKGKKFETVVGKQKTKIAELEGKLSQTKVDNVIRSAALKANVVDAEAVLQLIDRKSIKLEEDGSVTGVDEAVKSLVEQKTYLVGDGTQTNVGAGTSPAGGGNASPKFKHSQIQDAKFFKENETEIMEAMSKGEIEQDLPR